MMNIIYLCCGALVATVLAWMYLSAQQYSVDHAPAGREQPEARETDPETPEPELPVAEEFRPQRARFVPPGGKRMAFLIVMLLSLCGMAVALETIYTENTLVTNAKLLTLLAILFAAASVDARQQIIPNMLVLAGLALRVVFWCLELVTVPDQFLDIIKDDLLACLLVLVFWVVGVLLIKGGIGMGDIKLMLVMCLYQGFAGVVSSLFCSLFAAFVYAIVVLIMRRKTRKDSVAFAPSILLGTLLSVYLTGM